MNINAEFVERYQLELAKHPRSRVFAPLAEAYRKMGLIEEARRICEAGTRFHPDFAGGHVAFAKVLLDLKDPAAALPHLEAAAQLSPDNILAHSLMGETLLQLRRPKDALKAFKMVLFLNPEDAKAQAAVRKWEFLTADEYDELMFEMKPEFERLDKTGSRSVESLEDELEEILVESTNSRPGSRMELAQRHARGLDRALSLADAFTIRNDLEAALKVVEDAIRLLGTHPELEKRAGLLARRLQVLQDDPEETPEEEVVDIGSHDVGRDLTLDVAPMELELEADSGRDQRREKLESLLRRISERRT